jgi:threonine synthase
MRFVSTRGKVNPQPVRETVLGGLAPDGGLFLPEVIPDARPRLEEWSELPFAGLFHELVRLFLEGDVPDDELGGMIARSYARFDHPEVVPVVRVGGLYLLELFHGPTLAFKDVALQFLGNLFEHYLAQTGRRLTIAGATSGDTGSAAIHALRGKAGVQVFILFPKGRVSPMQELQMTTVTDANIHCIAVEGSFDDAQAIVKGLFNDRAFNEECSLGAVNSINWVRVMAQVVYYFHGYFRVVAQGGCRLGEPVRFAVPTGNFGNIFAGYLAGRMGLPLEKLILATNANDILHRFITTGVYRKGQVAETLSPSMDIQVASNFERYLFEISGRDGAQVTRWMQELADCGEFRVGADHFGRVQADFVSARVEDGTTVDTIREFHRSEGYLLDPHSAVGVRAALDQPEGSPLICMGSAHPAKFGEAVERAIGAPPPLPPALAGLGELPTRVEVLPAEIEPVQDFMRRTLAAAPLAAPE